MMKADSDLKDLVQSSLNDITVFEKSIVWNDMKTILKDWSEGLKEDYDGASNMEEVRHLQGISKCIEYMLNLPDAMKAILAQGEDDVS